MATLSAVPRDVYNKAYEILDTRSEFEYLKVCERGYNPREGQLTTPTLYPWGFLEFGGLSEVDTHRVPRVWDYDFVISIVVLTMADRNHPEDMVFSTGENVNPGIGDIALDLRSVYWDYKTTKFDVVGVNDYNILRTGTPTIMIIQPLLMHELIRGVQLDLAFQIIDRT